MNEKKHGSETGFRSYTSQKISRTPLVSKGDFSSKDAGKTTVSTSVFPANVSYAWLKDRHDTNALEMAASRLAKLHEYGISMPDLPMDVDEETLDDVLVMLREATGNYRMSPHRPGSKKYDSSCTEGLATQAFEALGYHWEDAHRRAMHLLADCSWEPDVSWYTRNKKAV